MTSWRFDSMVALVTGAGNVLGRQHALEPARSGTKVVVNDFALDKGGTNRAALCRGLGVGIDRAVYTDGAGEKGALEFLTKRKERWLGAYRTMQSSDHQLRLIQQRQRMLVIH